MDQIKVLQTIAENDHYTLNVVELHGVDLPCYGILSKKYGVCEMSTSVLANAKKLFVMLNDWEVNPDKDTHAPLPDIMPDIGSFQ